MEPTALAAAVVKQLGLAIKASGLYPPAHPGNVQAGEALLKALRAYAETHGQFRLIVGKHTLSVKGSVIEGRGNSDLAYTLYGRKLIQVTVLPTVSQQQLAAFVQIVGMDRATLEEGGGARQLLKASGVADIQVKELAMDADEEADTLGVDAFFGLLGQGRLKPQEREKLLEILRAGPEQAGRLLQNAYALAGKVGGGGGGDAQVQQVYQAIKGLERVILDEPYADHQSLYANLGEAALLPEGPEGALGPRLGRALVSGARNDQGTQVLLDHLSSEQLANIILNSLGEGDVVEQVADALDAFTPDPEKAGRILSFLDLALPKAGERGVPISVAVMMKLEFPAFVAPDEAPDFAEFDEGRIAVPAAERERVLGEIRSVDQAGVLRDALRACIDVLATNLDKEELTDVAESAVGHLDWLIEHREFALLREILTRVNTLASAAEGARAEVIHGLLERVADGPLLQKLLEAFWQGRATLAELEIQKCAEVLGGTLIAPLARALGAESRAGMRALLCDLLVRIGGEHVDEIGTFITDTRWYLVRNIASVLGRIGAPQGVAYLAQVVHHVDSRVRMQTLNALAGLGTDDAQGLIGEFLNDPDERIRLKALKLLDARGMEAALPTLIVLLETHDPFNRLFTIRQAGIETAARLGARGALPALKKLAHGRVVFRRRTRELRRLARVAVAAIEQPSLDGPAIAIADGKRSAP